MKTILSILLTITLGLSMFAQSPVNLKYNLELNKDYRVKSINNQRDKSTMQGVEQIKDTESTSYFTLKALNKGNDFFMAQVKFDSILYSISAPKMEINSSNEGNMTSEKPEEIMDCVLNRLCKSTLLVKMAYSGHVIDIMNHAVIEKAVLSDIDSLKGMMKMSLKPRIEMMVEKGSLKGMIESITVYLPNKEINKGEKWNTQFTNSQGLGSLISTDYTLNDINNNEASLSGDINIEPAGKTMEMNGAKITGELRGLGKTEMKINPNSGWIVNGKSNIQLSGNLNVNAQGQSFSIPMEITMNTENIGLN